jgi:hypothetical protein
MTDEHSTQFLFQGQLFGIHFVKAGRRFAVVGKFLVDTFPRGQGLRRFEQGGLTGRGQYFCGFATLRKGVPVFPGDEMGQEHLWRITIPYLDGVDMHLVFGVIDVHKDLRRIPNAGHRVVSMLAARQGKVGDRLQLKEKRAGDLEEVSE